MNSDKARSFDVDCEDEHSVPILYYAMLLDSQEFLAYIIDQLRDIYADQ